MSRAPLTLLALLCLRCTTTPASTDDSTSTSTDTSTSSTDSSTTTPTTGTAPCTDPAVCPPVCDTVLQDCPAGHKCTGVKPSLFAPYSGTACVPDNAGIGSPADSICINGTDGTDTCDDSSMCVQFGSGEGACAPFCTGPPGAPGCEDPARVCARTDRTWPLSLCVPPCDPLAYDCPDLQFGADVMVCQPAASGFGCVLRGHLQGAPLGQPCLDHRDCIAAARCAAPDEVPGCTGDVGCCAAYCDLGAPACPDPAQTCASYYAPGEAPPGLASVGLCTVP